MSATGLFGVRCLPKRPYVRRLMGAASKKAAIAAGGRRSPQCERRSGGGDRRSMHKRGEEPKDVKCECLCEPCLKAHRRLRYMVNI